MVALARLELVRDNLTTRARSSAAELHGDRAPQRGSRPERSCSACSTTQRNWWQARFGLRACEAAGRRAAMELGLPALAAMAVVVHLVPCWLEKGAGRRWRAWGWLGCSDGWECRAARANGGSGLCRGGHGEQETETERE
jgi:hypothetical protein